MKDIVFKIIDSRTKCVDTYNYNGSIWLIFTDNKRWVIELTKEGTLWNNYYFFRGIFKYVSLDVVENQHYITEWVESIIQNGVKHTDWCQIGTSTSIEDVIQNGVKHIQWWTNQRKNPIEDTIQNGVKRTELGGKDRKIHEIKDIVENGVKEIEYCELRSLMRADHIVEDGVKVTFTK